MLELADEQMQPPNGGDGVAGVDGVDGRIGGWEG